MPNLFATRLATVRGRIDAAARGADRDPADIRLLAVSKTFPLEAVRVALAVGCLELGESRAQELAEKAAALSGEPATPADVRWVFIGPIQTNKARDLARWADEVQSVDRLEVADALQRRLEDADRTLDVLLQVNTSGEVSKSGVASHAVGQLAREVAMRDRLHVRGLMTIATLGGDDSEARRCFRELAGARERLRGLAIPGVDAEELSMGMSGDLELAIAEGATTVRVGTALFGRR